MTPVQILAGFGLTAAEVASWSGAASTLADALEISAGLGVKRGANLAFYRVLAKLNPLYSQAELTTAYRAARYFGAMGDTFSSIQGNEPIAPVLARTVEIEPDQWRPSREFRYNVQLIVQYPGEDQPRIFNTWLYASKAKSREQITEEVSTDLFARFKIDSTPLEFGGTVDDVTWQISVVDFVHYEVIPSP
jgi:hypothetical protein